MSEKIIFATKKTLKQPSAQGLVIEAPQAKDHILGAAGELGGPAFEILVPDGQWAPYMPESELQRNDFGDTFMCVSFSLNNTHEALLKRLYDEIINKSDLFLGVGSGTVRGRGNSKRAVADFNRLNGFVLEGDYPYLRSTTLDDAYKPLTRALLEKGKKSLDIFDFGYKWLADNGYVSIKDGLKYSPVQVDVSGSYKMDRNGHVVWDRNNEAYTHEVIIFGFEEGKCWHVFDSETEQFLKFTWFYPFGSPMIHSVKKNMKIQLFKKAGQAGIAIKHVSEPSMIVFSGGSVSGDALFKSLYGIKDFKELPITEVAEWPFPVRHMINTNPTRGV